MLSKFLKSTPIIRQFSTFSRIQNVNLAQPGHFEKQKVTLIPGYGVGPEICQSVEEIFDKLKFPVEFETINNFELSNPQHLVQLKKNKHILSGILSKNTKQESQIDLYKELDLFAHCVFVESFPSVQQRHKNVDILIIRENTEGEYSGIEHEVYPGVIESIKIITREASLRIAEYAFKLAYLSGREKVTAVHKANIMKLCDGEFLKATKQVSKQYPMIKYEEMIIDNCCMQLVKNPQQFDVMVLPNLYGSIVSNICAGITGGIGMTPGATIGENNIIYGQGCKHSGKDIAGKNIANPTAQIMASIMMLKKMNLPRFADTLTLALNKTIVDEKVLTRDVGGDASTQDFTQAVIKNAQQFIPYK